MPYWYLNTLTANYEYSRSTRENLLQIQMQLSQKFWCFFIAFLEFPLNFDYFEKTNEPHSSSISEVIDSDRRPYLHG